MGIKLTKPNLLGVRLDELEFFWLVAVLMVLSLIVVLRILRSHLGRAFEALRVSPVACDCMGVSVYRNKVYAFVISAGFAGLAGALYAFSEQYISPNSYNFELTVLFLLAMIMGGRKSRIGSMVGATIIVLLPKLLDDIDMFRYVSVTLAALVIATTVFGIQKGRVTPKQMAIPVVGSIALAGLSFWPQTMTDWRLATGDWRLAAVDLRRDHAARRLLPAGWHCRFRAQRTEPAAAESSRGSDSGGRSDAR